ncbi:MAG TPA: hypothetical protein PK467_03690, partial [Candidatus Wallbacteria bacterium]|nr:hypothetical protein [Candidatus Wallbacteria bacterium]
ILKKLPLPDEEFVETWNSYFIESGANGVFKTLKKYLPQLNFPIEKGVSALEEYRAAVLAEKPVTEISANAGLKIEAEDSIGLLIHKTPAGSIPVITVRNRNDFETLYRALAFKNEPEPVPASTGACAISGYNNCGRYIAYKNKCAAEDPFGLSFLENPADQKSRYQDSFLLLGDGPYSGLAPSCAGFGEAEWRDYSLKIRLGHESVHYFTKRCLGSMRNNAHDELLADYAGICGAFGEYDAELFFKFCGIENFPEINPAGRINNYKGSPCLSDENFRAMCAFLYSAALNIERFDKKHRKNFTRGDFTTAAVLCIASASIDLIAAENGLSVLETALASV